jgi:hypothetical protein
MSLTDVVLGATGLPIETWRLDPPAIGRAMLEPNAVGGTIPVAIRDGDRSALEGV